jgi:hypothetical protein
MDPVDEYDPYPTSIYWGNTYKDTNHDRESSFILVRLGEAGDGVVETFSETFTLKLFVYFTHADTKDFISNEYGIDITIHRFCNSVDTGLIEFDLQNFKVGTAVAYNDLLTGQV